MKTLSSQPHSYFKTYDSLFKHESSNKMLLTMNSITECLFKKIEQGSLVVAEGSQNIILARGRATEEPKDKLQTIRQQKLEIMKKLQKINQQEVKAREFKEHHVSRQKSQLTQEDKLTLKKLNKAKKLFEKELQKKDEMARSRLLSLKEKQQQMLNNVKSKRHEQRTQQAKSKIEEIKIRSDQRKIKNQESNKLILELKKQKSLFKQMEIKWLQDQQKEGKKIQDLKDSIKEAKFVNFDIVRQHQRKYEETLENQRQQRQEKIRQIILMQRKIKEQLPIQSSTYKNMKFYDQNESRQMLFKNALPKINTEKRKQYSNLVKQSIFPNMKTQTVKTTVQEQQLRSMSTNELYEQGNKHMRQAKKMLSKIKQKQGQTPASTTTSSNATYANYLKEQRGKYKKPKNGIKELASLIEAEEFDQSEKIQKTKQCIDMLEMKNNNDEKKLIELMNLKLSMLQNLR